MSTQGPTSPLVAQSLDNLGALYSAQKRYPEAEPFFKKALSIRETQDIESLSNMGLLYEATNDMKRADEYFQRALLVGEKGLGGDHPEVTGTLKEYATMLHAAGRSLDAKKVEAHEKELKDKLTAQKASGPGDCSGASTGRGSGSEVDFSGKLRGAAGRRRGCAIPAVRTAPRRAGPHSR